MPFGIILNHTGAESKIPQKHDNRWRCRQAVFQVLAENPLICDCKLFTKIRGLLFSAQLTLRGIPALYLFILFRFCHKHKIIKYNGSRRTSGEHRVRG